VQAQDADLVVFSSTSQSSFLRSRIDAELRETVEAVDGVAEAGGIGVVQLGGRVPGNGPRDLVATALFGYELAPSGVPEPPAPGEVYADDVLRADGIEEGMELLLGPARTPVTVVGFVSDTTYSGQGSLWAEPGTWREVLSSNRPDEQLGDDVFQALVVRTDAGLTVGEVAVAIDDATGATESLTVSEAIDAIPGVKQQRSTFNQIIGVTIGIGVVVVGLFFALLTVERLALYGALKAFGARSRTLFAGLVVQAVVVASVASVVAAGLAVILDVAIPPGSIPLDITPRRIVNSAVLLLTAAPDARGVHYLGPWRLPGPDSHRLAALSLLLSCVTTTSPSSWRPSCWTHHRTTPDTSGQGRPIPAIVVARCSLAAQRVVSSERRRVPFGPW
jgi:putative ABC transport system permease protein